MFKSVSVAMAVYNGERYLKQQVDSILEQLGTNDELVISYDKSQDRTWDLISKYAADDCRVRVIRNTSPGVVSNFNNAIQACGKDVILISDQDDVWKPGKRNAMLGVLNDSGADLVIHNVVHIDAEGSIISTPLFEEFGIGKGLLRNFVAPRYSGCCMAFPASSRKIILPMPDSVANYDHWIGVVCEAFGKVVFDDRVFLEHRLHGSNVTTSRRKLRVIATQRKNLLIELIKRKKVLS